MIGGRTFGDWITVLIPAVMLISGVVIIITALLGSPKVYENSKNPKMQNQIARWGKTKARIINGIGGLLIFAFGAYLLYCWAFGPIQK